MRLVKIDPLLAEERKYEIVQEWGREYSAVKCPFCGHVTLVFYRNFHRGVRCKDPACRAMLNRCFGTAMRDMVPPNEAPAR